MYHVIAIPTYEDATDPGINIGQASDKASALTLIADAGYRVIPEDDGGLVAIYDATDAPHIYSYEPDGLGAIGVTVEPAA